MELEVISCDIKVNDKKKESRRVWTKAEEAALLNILDSVILEGGRTENGTFKPGTYIHIEKALTKVLPKSGLKASPHIDSKMRKWKKQYGVILDMLNTDGFIWNDAKKCVMVDSDATWESYIQSHTQARKWRNKPFPIYERLINIFGMHRATRCGAATPGEMVEEINLEKANGDALEVNGGALEVNGGCSPVSVAQPSSSQHSMGSQFEISSKKRGRSRDDLIIGIKEIATSFERAYSRSVELMDKLVERLINDREDRSDIADELAAMGLSEDDEFEALTLILDKPSYISAFKSLRGERKVAFTKRLVRKKART
ncbi:uncharacterized protein LOC116132773 [Pistacia vera]|uniref:uncharacterized protein LOC116132773 n=1 Tax=Pistacia vera TaxID=55513 RepID=UPI0012631709|nr:uncharacterized protein LOC116132773 [Pistacia vera]XP_031274303.1 uncharacterized protein LOC116132773 [Pistacia vera]XP_031274304.1 uncharacterized protein LOC116132773 [Pistacia vera]